MIDVPIDIHFGTEDKFADLKDAEKLEKELKASSATKYVSVRYWEDFGHASFANSVETKKFYGELIKDIKNNWKKQSS